MLIKRKKVNETKGSLEKSTGLFECIFLFLIRTAKETELAASPERLGIGVQNLGALNNHSVCANPR